MTELPTRRYGFFPFYSWKSYNSIYDSPHLRLLMILRGSDEERGSIAPSSCERYHQYTLFPRELPLCFLRIWVLKLVATPETKYISIFYSVLSDFLQNLKFVSEPGATDS